MEEPTSLVLRRDHLAAWTGQPPQGTGHLDLERWIYLPLTPSWENSLHEGRVVWRGTEAEGTMSREVEGRGWGEAEWGQNPRHSWSWRVWGGGQAKEFVHQFEAVGEPWGGLCRSDSQGNGSILQQLRPQVLIGHIWIQILANATYKLGEHGKVILCLSYLICKMGIIIVFASKGYYQD